MKHMSPPSTVSQMSPGQAACGIVTRGPLVTIAIPTFNRASWLKKCIAGALNQTYSNFEILVSDNASTDETVEVVREFTDGRVRLIRNETNIGIIPNWNACLMHAKGNYIVYCSDDDLLNPRMLELCLSIAVPNPQVPIVLGLCDFDFIQESYFRTAMPSTRFSTGLCDGIALLVEFLRNDIMLGNCAMMIRTQDLRASGGLPMELSANGADVGAWAPLLMRGKVGFVNESCATYRVHNATETGSHSIEQRLEGERKLTNYLVAKADEIVEDVTNRRWLQRQAKLFLAGRALFAMAQYRKRGEGVAEMIPWLWRWRDEMSYLRLGNPVRLAKLAALALVPAPLYRNIQRLK